MELLIRNPELPARAGKARIEFGTAFDAKRDEDVISLPLHERARFFPIAKGEQFLFEVPPKDYRNHEWTRYFGGTDEDPFLVQLQARPFAEFRSGGEEAFFDALVPDSVKRIKKVLGIQHKRQGDIFAVPLPISWDGLRAMEALRLGISIHEVEPKTQEFSVFETRHVFKGTTLEAPLYFPDRNLGLFVEGRLRAPDHDDLSFREPHFLEQTAYLWNPKQAD